MVGVSKLLEWSRIDSSLTIKGKKLFVKFAIKNLNIILCNNLKKLINIFKNNITYLCLIFIYLII